MSKREDDFFNKVNSLFQREGLSGSLVVLTSSDIWEKQLSGDVNSTVFLSKRENLPKVENISGIALTDYWEELPEILTELISQKSAPIVYLRVGLEEQEKIQDLLFSKGYIGQKTPSKTNEVASFYHRSRSHKKLFDTEGYWEKRYSEGGNSGSGSRGRLAQFEADFLSEFVDTFGVKSVIEFGCGDGYIAAMASFPKYLGLDISQSVIDTCNQRFAGDETKKFDVYDSESFLEKGDKAELALSLDVIFHLSNESDYESHLRDLFKSAEKYVIIYSNSTSFDQSGFDSSQNYMKFRNFLNDSNQFDEWSLVGSLPNRYPFSVQNPSNTSVSDFFIFSKGGQDAAAIQNLIAQPSENLMKVIGQLRVMDENFFDTQALLKNIETRLTAKNSIADEKQQELERLLAETLQRLSEIKNENRETRQSIVNYKDNQSALEASQQELTELKQLKIELEGSLQDSHKEQQRLNEENLAIGEKLQKARQLYYSLLSSRWTRIGFFLFGWPTKLKNKLKVLPGRLSVSRIRKSQSIKQSSKNNVHPKEFDTEEKIKTDFENKNSNNSWTPPKKEAWELSVRGWTLDFDDKLPKALTVLDEFSESSFRGSINIYNPRPDNWYGLAMKSKPDFILVESAWKGNGGSWQYRVGSYNFPPGRELREMLDWARSESIPTVFWNKEDPVHFEKFLEAAKMVDFVYTSDENMVGAYKRKTSAKSVKSLMFAANPRIHRPASLVARESKIAFAGTWYGERYPKRSSEMHDLLTEASNFDLDIFDRNFGTGRFEFPEKFQKYIRGSKTYEEICLEYRKYRAFLNVNSVDDSPTMFSRRVFELLASGTPVVSTESLGVRRVFGGKVAVVNGAKEASEALERLMNDEEHWRNVSLSGIREVLTNHTYDDRVNQILDDIGISNRSAKTPKVLVVGKFESENQIAETARQLSQQSYRNFDFVAVINQNAKLVMGETTRDFGFLVAEKALRAENLTDYEIVGIVGPENVYGAQYLQDLINARKLEADAVSWSISTNPVTTFQFSESFNIETSIMSRHRFIEQWQQYNLVERVVGSGKSFNIDSNEAVLGSRPS